MQLIDPALLESAIEKIALCSPYLARLHSLFPDIAQRILSTGLDSVYDEIAAQQTATPTTSKEIVMRQLRVRKQRAALCIALADLMQAWPLARVTQALSEIAQSSVQSALSWLLWQAHARGEIALPNHSNPQEHCGIIVLAMGKMGAYELNYSSDIDLILLFEPNILPIQGRISGQEWHNKLAHDLVQLMQERTREGYVFRTDLRLRPDPLSTPPVVRTTAAMAYYEAVGQNWERAAMIKARQTAGDFEAGSRFLRELVPFVWRKHLDFEAINDIQSIKRQMDSRHNPTIILPGHNIKTGLGGIREIEFFVQIHQLIWGGRKTQLRGRGTCEMLAQLLAETLITQETHDTLITAYDYLRTLEHRLQMVDDQQTHSLPTDSHALAQLASFCSAACLSSFEIEVTGHLQRVHGIFSDSFRSAGALGDEGKLVFTGVSHDAETLETLRHLGFLEPEHISERIMHWHRGAHRCTRTKRARELLTELIPQILRAFGQTPHADQTFQRFDEFLAHLPSGVQFFSLCAQNASLLPLIAQILGTAPKLAETLSKMPQLMEYVIYPANTQSLKSCDTLAAQINTLLRAEQDYEWRLDALRRFKQETQFSIGTQLLQGHVSAEQCAIMLSNLAQVLLQSIWQIVEKEFTASYGNIPGGVFCIIALGKLGSREMTMTSDLDLMFFYDVPDFELLSDGEKQFTASVYYNRLAQRYLTALTALGAHGRLYEVDTRLRPSGKQGLLAVSLQAVTHYFAELAWTFERMALTRARAVAGNTNFQKRCDDLCAHILTQPRDAGQVLADVHDMRMKVAAEFPTKNPWNVKHVAGGMMDIDFIAQACVLIHAHAHPFLAQCHGTPDTLRYCREHSLMPGDDAQLFENAYDFYATLLQWLRLTHGEDAVEHIAPSLQPSLAHALHMPDFAQTSAHLLALESRVRQGYTVFFQPHSTGEPT